MVITPQDQEVGAVQQAFAGPISDVALTFSRAECTAKVRVTAVLLDEGLQSGV